MTGKSGKMSNFPSGFSKGLSVRDVNINVAHPGKVFYVGDGTTAGTTVAYPNRRTPSDGNNGSFLAPFATIDYAIGQCTADRGDTIFVLPGYSENISAADAIDIDVDGVTIIGLGSGDKQPKIQFDNAAATVAIDADNVTVMGLNFAASVTSVTKGIDVKDGADDFRIEHNRFSADALTTDEFLDAIFVTTADRGVIKNNYFDMDEAGAQSAIHLVGVILGCEIADNYITGDYAVGNIESVTTAQEQIVIDGNTLINGAHSGLNTVANISLLTGTTGVIQNNNLYTNVTNAVTAAISADACFLSNNTIVNAAESPAVTAEALGRGRLEMTSLAGVETTDEGEASVTFACNGPVDIYGVWGLMTTGADTAEEITLSTESGVTLMALGEIHTATAAGDVFFAAEPGATPTVDEIGTAESWVWDNPVRITGTEDLIDMLAEGAATTDAGEATLYVLWSPVVSGAEIQTV